MDFLKGKRIFLTGHTGFKGSWLSLWLQKLGAQVTGYALEPATCPSLFNILNLQQSMESILGDIENYHDLQMALKKSQPEMIIHMAAQSLVGASYEAPLPTYRTNVLGVCNLLEVGRTLSSLKVILNVSSDKCYVNKGPDWVYCEEDPLGGEDPYSSSKACSEIITAAYFQSFLKDKRIAVATVRAGNVIGGGDFNQTRLVPGVIQACTEGKNILLRYPSAIRPWQHVLEPLYGYLKVLGKLYQEPSSKIGTWNFGPAEENLKTASVLAEAIIHSWGSTTQWSKSSAQSHPYEAQSIRLNTMKAQLILGWKPRWSINTAINKTVEWYKAYFNGDNMRNKTISQLASFTGSTLKQNA